jgi:hypothetical protein
VAGRRLNCQLSSRNFWQASLLSTTSAIGRMPPKPYRLDGGNGGSYPELTAPPKTWYNFQYKTHYKSEMFASK